MLRRVTMNEDLRKFLDKNDFTSVIIEMVGVNDKRLPVLVKNLNHFLTLAFKGEVEFVGILSRELELYKRKALIFRNILITFGKEDTVEKITA